MIQRTVAYARREDLDRVNQLRAQVSALHAQGRPDIFRPDFSPQLRDHVYEVFDSPGSDVVVVREDGVICGFAMVEYIRRPLSPYNLARSFYHMEEFGVDPALRRRSHASALMDFCRREARRMGYPHVELDMWEFNRSALRFYEVQGFRTIRRYMELDV